MSRTLFALPTAALLVSLFASGPGTRAAGVAAFGQVRNAQRRPAVAQARPTSTDQDWCRDAERNYDRDREVFCEVRDLRESGASRLEVLDNRNGSISVTGSTGRDITVQARVVATAESDSDARALARDVSVTLDNGRLRATGPESERRRSWSVSYRVNVPSSFDVNLETSNGSVAVEGVRGRIDMESSNGSVRLTDVGGRVNARTSNGSVHVTLTGRRWEGDGMTVITSNGSARLDVPENYNAHLIAGTSNGSLNLDIPVTVQGRVSKRIDTTLGSGGATIEMRTSNGSLRIGRR
jgi:DUF4097 and DUF4098 domain-containing protein YvlB